MTGPQLLVMQLDDRSPEAARHREEIHGGRILGNLQVFAVCRPPATTWDLAPAALTCRLCAWPKGAAEPADPEVLAAIEECARGGLGEQLMRFATNATVTQLAAVADQIMPLLTDQASGFDCEAYGPRGTAIGALCFVGELHTRRCASRAECAATMATQRVAMFNRMRARAAEGDEAMRYLAEEITSPEQLFGGSEVDQPDHQPDHQGRRVVLTEVARAVRDLPRPGNPRTVADLLDELTALAGDERIDEETRINLITRAARTLHARARRADTPEAALRVLAEVLADNPPGD